MNKLLLRIKNVIKKIEGDFNEKDLKTINSINCGFDIEFDKDDFEYSDLISINNKCTSKEFVLPEVDQDLLEEIRNECVRESFIPPEVDQDLLEEMRNKGLI